MPDYTVHLPTGKAETVANGEKLKPGDGLYPDDADIDVQIPWVVDKVNHGAKRLWAKEAPAGFKRKA